MRYSIRKTIPTKGFKYRVQVKAFKSSEAMHRFLNSQYDNAWRVMDNPLKSGIYIEEGVSAKLINTRDIDSSALAHM